MNPEKIGRYEIKSELGRGGMATVYRAWDPRFEREVALKVLPREMMHDGSFRVRFEREAKTVASLEHPAIVPVYDVGEEDNQPYFVMRLMVGGSLAETISKGPISLQDAAKIMSRLGPALDVAHAKGIIHRDLKPGNILFDRTGEPYVSDFGIAKIAQSQGSTVTGGAIIGTPAYMSPEQAQGDPLDGRSDIYALGVILYEMLAGSQPYQATTPMAVVVKHITDPIPHILDTNPRLPAGIEIIIEKAMAKNPNQRFSTAGEFATALNALVHGESAEDALKTAVLSVSNTQAVKTRMAGKEDVTRVTTNTAAKKGASPFNFILPIAGVAVVIFIIGVIAAGYFLLGPGKAALFPSPTETATLPPATETVKPEPTTDTNTPTETAESAITVTATQPAVETETPTPNAPLGGPVVGGADMVAFIANGDVWLMNIDGSKLRQLTEDGGVKTALHWMPDGKTLVYISGKNINTIDIDGRADILMTFPNTQFLDSFRVSPDGKQVAISMNREIFVVPLDFEQLKNAHGRDALLGMKGCVAYAAGTQSADAAREFRWSVDSKLLSWMFLGKDLNNRQADLVRIFDITPCDPTRIKKIDEFPGVRFETSRPSIVDYDWDGKFLFMFNTLLRNEAWGDLYTYNSDIHKGSQLKPIGGKCCYQGTRWSPDGTFVFFAFQDRNLSIDAPTLLYYVPFGALDTGAEFKPIPMPDKFFKNQREAIDAALHIAQ